jgi:hypothetical protein
MPSDKVRYYAHISAAGPIRREQVPGSIGVLEAPDKPMPIGEASCVSLTTNGLALWRLVVHGQEVAGRWVIVDRQFIPAKRD